LKSNAILSSESTKEVASPAAPKVLLVTEKLESLGTEKDLEPLTAKAETSLTVQARIDFSIRFFCTALTIRSFLVAGKVWIASAILHSFVISFYYYFNLSLLANR
jgi:hypothetical protein